jgi:cytochrome P450
VAIDYDPFDERWRDDPYPAYRALRDADGCRRSPASGFHLVSRYDACVYVLKHPELFSSRAMIDQLRPAVSFHLVRFLVLSAVRVGSTYFPFGRPRNVISEDPPGHGDLRNTISRSFTPRRIAGLEPRVREVVARLAAPLRQGPSFDVIRDLANPLPVTIMAELLGIESDRRADFKRWSDVMLASATGSGRARPFSRAFGDTLLDLSVYLREAIARRRRTPGDDLISALAVTEAGDRPLSELEIIMFVQLLIVAGSETTTNLLGNAGNAVLALLAHPEQLEIVRADPSLVPALVEETLRYDSPVQLVLRTATRDVDLLGARVPRGATVAVLLGSANRDERRFEAPDRFDVRRDARGHLSFSGGAHFCLGAALARLEASIALEALVPELGRFARSDGTLERVDSFLARGVRRLPLQRTGSTSASPSQPVHIDAGSPPPA